MPEALAHKASHACDQDWQARLRAGLTVAAAGKSPAARLGSHTLERGVAGGDGAGLGCCGREGIALPLGLCERVRPCTCPAQEQFFRRCDDLMLPAYKACKRRLLQCTPS